MNLVDILAVARLHVGVVVGGEGVPFRLAGHRIDEVSHAEQTDFLAAIELDRFGQLFQILRPWSLLEVLRVLHAGRTVRRLRAELVVAIDRFGDPAQALMQLDLLLPPDAEVGQGHGHGGEDSDDRDDGDQLRDGEAGASGGAAIHQSTFARPPDTDALTSVPLPLVRLGFSSTRYVSPGAPPRTRSEAMSPPPL